ncbi:heparanase-like [Cyprinus carpio]|uniref:Heparanase-like n=1 Tax=Cyprinus carpio TaxID=7962 RepID=A0A9Q9VLS2_CYPCA|nr:heparanase-like [Cyprinus carpio]
MKSAATASFTIVALALFGALYVGAKTVISVDDVQSIRVDLDLSHVARRVDERFLSVAIDASLITEEKFMNLLKQSIRYTILLTELLWTSPHLRIQCSEPNKTKHTAQIKNAELLLKYCESRQYVMSWELGNEPNSYEKKAGIRVDGYQLGQDFVHLHQILQQSAVYNSTGLYGPDVSQPRDHRRDLLTGFLETGAKAITACTWHHYYVNGRDTSLEDFLDPEVLDTLATKINEVLEIVESASPGKKVWLGETSSAYGGGAVGLSDTFVAGFMWLDKLGLAAKLGLDVVIRQVLIGSGTYHLVDDNLDPLPDYWLSLLYKRLVGPEVLKAEVNMNSGPKKPIRVYLHCTNRKSTHYRPGAVTLFALNLNKNEVTVILPDHMANSTIEAFVLQSAEAGEQSLYSRSVKLNGQVLRMVDDRTLPLLKGRELPPGEHIKLPGFSFAFYVLIEAQAAVCK